MRKCWWGKNSEVRDPHVPQNVRRLSKGGQSQGRAMDFKSLGRATPLESKLEPWKGKSQKAKPCYCELGEGLKP